MPATSGGVEVKIIALGDVQISRRIMRVGERAFEAIPLWTQVYEDLLKIETVQFLTEGGHGSGGWSPLADSTKAEKQRKRQSPWIERATEALFRSLTAPAGPNQIFERTSGWMRFGTRVPYGIFSQTGTVKMPQRKLIDLKLVERRMIVKTVQRFLITGEVMSIFSGVA